MARGTRPADGSSCADRERRSWRPRPAPGRTAHHRHGGGEAAADRQAEAEGLKMLKEADPNKEVITLKSFEALTKVADGKSTKIIIPSNLQDIANIATAFSETIKTDNIK